MESSSVAEPGVVQLSTEPPGHQYSSVIVNDQAHLHQGDVYHQNIVLLQSKPEPAIESFGVCLGNAPQISADAFKGRQDDLEFLQSSLLPADKPGRSIVNIVGIGGVGKTQLGLAYAREHGHRYSSVFWVRANDETTVQQELALLHQVIYPDSVNTAMRTSEDEQLAVERVKRWLSKPKNDKWLMIFDNYDNPNVSETRTSPTDGFDIRPFFPTRSQGNMILTTRSTKLFFSQQLYLGKIEDIATSVSILSQRSRRDLGHDPEAISLARRLDGLPLALASAGSFLASTTISCSEYCGIYESMWKELFDVDEGQLADYPQRTLATTWAISLSHVQAQDQNAARLFEFMAYLSPRDIWYELIKAGASAEIPWLAHVTQNQVRFQRAMSKLHEICLVDVVGKSYQLHPCMHDWLVQQLPHPPEKVLFEAAVQCVDGCIRCLSWDQLVRLSDHANQLTSPHFLALWEFCSAAEVFRSAVDRIVSLQTNLGLYRQAEGMCRVALTACEKTLGLRHLSSLIKRLNLGVICHSLHNFEESESCYLKILVRLSQKQDIDNRTVSKVLADLDVKYLNQDTMSEEERTVAFKAVGNLITIYQTRSKQAEAAETEKWMLQILEGRPEVDDSGLLCIVSALLSATRHQSLGADISVKSEIKEHYLSQGWTKWKHPVASDSPYIMRVFAMMGRLYSFEKQFDAAEKMLTRALQGSERIFGADNHYTRCHLLDLSVLYSLTSRLSEAEDMFTRAVTRQEGEFDLTVNAETSHAALKLGDLHLKYGNVVRAEEFCMLSYDTRAKLYGPNHPTTLYVLHTLARIYKKKGQSEQADSTSRQMMVGFRHHFGLEQLARIFDMPVHELSKLVGREDIERSWSTPSL